MMKKRAVDKNMPIGKLTKVADFLPPPNELVAPDRNVKVTILLNEASIEFFKRQAHKYHTKYQKMIRQVLDQYASKYQAA